MRAQFIFGAFLLFVTATALSAPDGDPLPSADTVVARMLAQEAQRQTLAAGYHGMRRYVLDNDRMHKHAEMLVRVQCDADGIKHFEVVEVEGWKGANKHVLHKMLESEAEASDPQLRMKSRLSQENYEFRMASTALLDGRTAYAIDIVPKRYEDRLFKGRIWIDGADYALVRAEGEPAKNLSFWTRSVHFIQTYRKSGPFWYPASTESVTDVRIFGSASLTISYIDYTPNPPQASETANAVSKGVITP
jgi:hypothetical protein